jgi:hypothetical protein
LKGFPAGLWTTTQGAQAFVPATAELTGDGEADVGARRHPQHKPIERPSIRANLIGMIR